MDRHLLQHDGQHKHRNLGALLLHPNPSRFLFLAQPDPSCCLRVLLEYSVRRTRKRLLTEYESSQLDDRVTLLRCC